MIAGIGNAIFAKVKNRSGQHRIGGGQASYAATGLLHGHEYEFAILASHGGGTSPSSAKVKATASYALPGAPTGLTATAKIDGTIALANAQTERLFGYTAAEAIGQPLTIRLIEPDRITLAGTAGSIDLRRL